MKKFFAFAIAIVAMATSLVSCNNDDTEFVAQKTPVATEQASKECDLNLMVTVSDEQTKYFDEIYVIEIGQQRQIIRVSDMMPITTEQACAYDNAKELAESFDVDSHILIYPLGKISKGQTAKVVSHELIVKANHPTEQFDYIDGSCFVTISFMPTCINSSQVHRGIYGDDDNLTAFAEVMAKSELKAKIIL